METQRKGMRAERVAQQWLEAQGLELLEKNFLRKTGELDLIMLDAETIVFVEVRYRSRTDYGGALASIGASKQRKILNTAMLYLQIRRHNQRDARIDIVTIEGSLDRPKCRWIKNAIQS